MQEVGPGRVGVLGSCLRSRIVVDVASQHGEEIFLISMYINAIAPTGTFSQAVTFRTYELLSSYLANVSLRGDLLIGQQLHCTKQLTFKLFSADR